VLDVDCTELRAPQRAGEAEEQQRPITAAACVLRGMTRSL
jgi:hypothetical protein